MNRSLQHRAAFTLLEVLLVLVIIGLLAALVSPQIFGIGERAKVDQARGQIHSLHQACDYFRLSMNGYPASIDQLVSGSELGTNWSGPYIERVPEDPWGNQYVYEPQATGMKPRIYSLGPDGAPGTDDDVYRDEELQ